jgi:dephospho-CoA kinase
MSRVLLTGISGTGKSSALVELGRRGFRVVDTDDEGWREYRQYLEPIDELHRGEFLWVEDRMTRAVGLG